MAHYNDINVWLESASTNTNNERETLYTDPCWPDQSFRMLAAEDEKMCSMRVRASKAFCSGKWDWLRIQVQVGEREPELYLVATNIELLGLTGVELERFELPGAIPGIPFGPDLHRAPIILEFEVSCGRIAHPSKVLYTPFQVIAEEIPDFLQDCGIAWFNDAFVFPIHVMNLGDRTW
ncbi:hypothetical protein BKA80DRAFT_310721 [Phyllosticta citrichinensis]